MFFSKNRAYNIDADATLEALDKSQATIEFVPDGTILTANNNFLQAMGYTLDEIKGKHHSMFVEPAYAKTQEYRDFWAKLARGEFQVAQYKRFGKGGREVWIEASYNPVVDEHGNTFKVIKYATDITKQKLIDADFSGQIDAIGKSQAVIHFNMDGTIINANQNFLSAVGYSLAEIKGKHHGMFVEPSYRTSTEYKQFWETLNRGEYLAGEYKRVAKGGREIWLNASYNPIMDMNGRPFKVVKYATDITKQVDRNALVKKIVGENMGQVESAITNVSHQSTNASSSAVQASANVQTVAAAAEQLNASVKEISGNMTKSKDAVEKVVEQAAIADQSTQRLVSTSQSMGSIVQLIQSIAGQINLLALNATIESARAGEAGKGFAVVASEVKNLAGQTAKATEQISKEIEGMQVVSGDVVKALETIKESVESVRQYVTGVASAIEEQSAVTREISSNMQTASTVVSTISENISLISDASEKAAHAAKEVKDAAKVLAD